MFPTDSNAKAKLINMYYGSDGDTMTGLYLNCIRKHNRDEVHMAVDLWGVKRQ